MISSIKQEELFVIEFNFTQRALLNVNKRVKVCKEVLKDTIFYEKLRRL